MTVEKEGEDKKNKNDLDEPQGIDFWTVMIFSVVGLILCIYFNRLPL